MARMTMWSVSASACRASIMATPMAGCVMALSSSRASSSAKATAASALRSMVPSGARMPGSEAVDQRLVGGAAGRHHVAGHLVGVDEHGAPFDEQVGDGRLARADAAGQADGQHQPAAVPARRRATAKRTRVVSSGSSVTNQSSAVMPVTPPVSCRATSR